MNADIRTTYRKQPEGREPETEAELQRSYDRGFARGSAELRAAEMTEADCASLIVDAVAAAKADIRASFAAWVRAQRSALSPADGDVLDREDILAWIEGSDPASPHRRGCPALDPERDVDSEDGWIAAQCTCSDPASPEDK